MTISKAEMNFDGLREDKVPPPGGVHKKYVEERAVPQATKQGAKYARPFVGETTKYHYDLQGHLIAETNAAGQTQVEYVYLGGQPLAMIRSTEQVFYYHNDHLGTPQVMTNASGVVAWKAAYNAFGNATMITETITNNIRFPGQYYDSETGLYYNGNRYYDPMTGRYITADPIGLEGGINLFSYVANDPVNWIDPRGLLAEVLIWQPVGWGQSSLGHVSANINGTAYSFGPNGTTIEPNSQYMSRPGNASRSAVGSELNLTPDQEAKLQACLSGEQGGYGKVTNNCGTPVQRCLNQLGLNIGSNILPVNLGYSLMNSGLVTHYNFYPATQPAIGSSAPWAR